MKKALNIITIIAILFFANIKTSAAQPIKDACDDISKCYVLCNYQSILKGNSGGVSGTNTSKRYRNITLVYNYDTKEIGMYWETLHTNYSVLKKIGAIDYIFSKSGTNVYWAGNRNLSLSQFSCPANGYFDTDDWNGGNEFCFDDDGETCRSDYSNMGTAFAKGQDFISTEKDYDFNNDINNYATNFISRFKEDITSGKYKLAEDLEETIKTDFQTNYLGGNKIPEFIVNSESYKNIVNTIMTEFKKAAKDEVEKADDSKESKLKQAKEVYDKQLERLATDLRHGVITQETYDNGVKSAKEEYDKKVAEINGEHQEVINNWGACVNDKELEEAKKKKQTELTGARKQYEIGVVTEEAYKKKVEQVNKTYEEIEARYSPDCKNEEDIEETLTQSFEHLSDNIEWLADFNVSSYCESYLGSPTVKGTPAYYLQFIFNLIKYAAIIILFVMTVVEFIKASASNNQDAMKKALNNTIKRLIIAVIIFMLPILIEFLFTVLGAYSPDTCGIF